MKLTAVRLRKELSYYPETGLFTWRIPRPGRKVEGCAGCSTSVDGYPRICIDGTLYLAHRLAWLYMTGSWPVHELDHKNGIRFDNKWLNLREATSAENRQNASLRCDSVSSITGVSWHKQRKKWRAYIVLDQKQRHLGLFSDKIEAGTAYARAKSELHTFNPISRGAWR